MREWEREWSQIERDGIVVVVADDKIQNKLHHLRSNLDIRFSAFERERCFNNFKNCQKISFAENKRKHLV